MSEDSSRQATARTRGLGSGLAALLGGAPEASVGDSTPTATRVLPIASLKAGRLQPRHEFDDQEIDALAVSIRQQGIIQPILVRPDQKVDGDYEIIAGERRWRAAQRAGLHDVPVVVHFIGDQDALEIALIENLQRQDLNILEEATAYNRLMNEYGNTQEEVAKGLGRSRSHVANTVRLLTLPGEVKRLIIEGTLSAGHARALVGTQNTVELAQRIIAERLNVRQTEKMLQTINDDTGLFKNPKNSKQAKSADVKDLEDSLTRRFGSRVTITEGKRGGKFIFQYKTLEQLDEFLKRLS